MKNLYLVLGALMLLTTACDNDLDQFPSNIASSDSLTDFSGVLNAAYYYSHTGATAMAMMGDFRADNALMFEAPYTEFDNFSGNLVDMEDQFFGPFYTDMYKSILSANNVIENSTNATEVGEAQFLRGLAYFKLVKAFGATTVVTTATPSVTDQSILARTSAADVYSSVIIPDLQAAASALGAGSNGRASKMAARGMLGKVYMQQGNYSAALAELSAVTSGAAAAGISLVPDFANIFGEANDLNSEIIYATQISSSVIDTYGDSEFWSWYGGLDTKSLQPLDPDLIAAFDASPGDLRRAVTINDTLLASPKYPQTNGDDHDWIELRLADVMLLQAEAMNETGSPAADVLAMLDPIRERAGLAPLDAANVSSVKQAIADERRLELAFEGQRWFDLVRTGTVDAEMGQTISSDYYLFPVPLSEVLASGGVITQNAGY